MDVGGRYSCSAKGDMGSTGMAGRVDDSMTGRVSAREDGDEMDVEDIVEVIDGMEGVGMRSRRSEQGISWRVGDVV